MGDFLATVNDVRWAPSPLDWSVSFPRSPQHLSNQLRGKRLNSQLELFEDVFNGLKPEVQKQVREKAISVVGFDLTVNQQRAYEAGLRLLAASRYQSRRLVITPQEWLMAYDLEQRTTSRGWKETSGQERSDAFSALIGLAGIPWLISYKKLDGGRWYLIQRVSTFWKIELRTPLGQVSADPEKIDAHQLSGIDHIAIEFDDVWFDQRDQYYFYKPARLYTRLALTLPGRVRRQPQHLHPFLDWIFSEAGRLRVQYKHEPVDQQTWEIRSPWMELAHQCRMSRQLEHRNYKRVQSALLESARLAQAAQIISSYELQEDHFVVTFDNRIFADLDEYLTQQRQKQTRVGERRSATAKPKRSALWRDRSRYSLSEINRLIEEHAESIKAIRSRIPFTYDVTQSRSVPVRELTSEEAEHIQHHRSAIEELREIKLGVRSMASNGDKSETITTKSLTYNG